MVILIKLFKFNEDNTKLVFPGVILKKLQIEDIPFNPGNINSWIRFIQFHFADIIKKEGNKIRWQVYLMGGNPSWIQYFPGIDNKGKPLSVKEYGVI